MSVVEVECYNRIGLMVPVIVQKKVCFCSTRGVVPLMRLFVIVSRCTRKEASGKKKRTVS
jgi:hypothetical protein